MAVKTENVEKLTQKMTMDVKIYAPFEVFFEGKAYSVSAVNDVGPFDVLPHHYSFLSMLVPCNIVVETPEGRRAIHVDKALMHVRFDRVVVFVNV